MLLEAVREVRSQGGFLTAVLVAWSLPSPVPPPRAGTRHGSPPSGLGAKSPSCSNWTSVRQVKQIMEEAVTRKFVHEDSSHIISFCGESPAAGCRRHLGLQHPPRAGSPASWPGCAVPAPGDVLGGEVAGATGLAAVWIPEAFTLCSKQIDACQKDAGSAYSHLRNIRNNLTF